MNFMPKNIWVYRDLKENLGVCFAVSAEPYNEEQKKRYTDADISEARIAKLEDALDVAEKALDFYATGEHEHPVGVIDDMYVYDNGTRAWNALEKIKQAKGEA